MMTEPGRLNNGQKIPYGLALTLGEIRGHEDVIAHSGAFGGYRTEMVRFPEVDIGVVTLCNTSAVSPTLAEQVGTLMLGVTPSSRGDRVAVRVAVRSIRLRRVHGSGRQQRRDAPRETISSRRWRATITATSSTSR